MLTAPQHTPPTRGSHGTWTGRGKFRNTAMATHGGQPGTVMAPPAHTGTHARPKRRLMGGGAGEEYTTHTHIRTHAKKHRDGPSVRHCYSVHGTNTHTDQNCGHTHGPSGALHNVYCLTQPFPTIHTHIYTLTHCRYAHGHKHDAANTSTDTHTK